MQVGRRRQVISAANYLENIMESISELCGLQRGRISYIASVNHVAWTGDGASFVVVQSSVRKQIFLLDIHFGSLDVVPVHFGLFRATCQLHISPVHNTTTSESPCRNRADGGHLSNNFHETESELSRK